jgi:hypothetical protein
MRTTTTTPPGLNCAGIKISGKYFLPTYDLRTAEQCDLIGRNFAVWKKA